MITSGSSGRRRQRVPRSRMKSRRSGTGASWAGPLVGHTDGERIVVTDANGVGVGVETPRGETWMLPARGCWLDFALACRADIVGDSALPPWRQHHGSLRPRRQVMAGDTRGARLTGVRRSDLRASQGARTGHPLRRSRLVVPSAPGRRIPRHPSRLPTRQLRAERGGPPRGLRLPEEVRRLARTGGAP